VSWMYWLIYLSWITGLDIRTSILLMLYIVNAMVVAGASCDKFYSVSLAGDKHARNIIFRKNSKITTQQTDKRPIESTVHIHRTSKGGTHSGIAPSSNLSARNAFMIPSESVVA